MCFLDLNYVKPSMPPGRSREVFLTCLSLLTPEKPGRKWFDRYQDFEAKWTEQDEAPVAHQSEMTASTSKTTRASRRAVAMIAQDVQSARQTLSETDLRKFYSDTWWGFLKKIYEYVDPDVYDPYHGFLQIVDI